MDDTSLKLSGREITTAFGEPIWANRFPPVLTLNQAADFLQIPPGTLRDWRSRGILTGCCRKLGKHVRFFRERLMQRVFNEELYND